jgi:hypothetical protein
MLIILDHWTVKHIEGFKNQIQDLVVVGLSFDAAWPWLNGVEGVFEWCITQLPSKYQSLLWVREEQTQFNGRWCHVPRQTLHYTLAWAKRDVRGSLKCIVQVTKALMCRLLGSLDAGVKKYLAKTDVGILNYRILMHDMESHSNSQRGGDKNPFAIELQGEQAKSETSIGTEEHPFQFGPGIFEHTHRYVSMDSDQ